MPATTLITTPQFSRLIGLPGTPAIVDVRIDDDYRADPRLVPGSQRLRSSQASTSGLVLSLAAALAIFRFKLGMLPTLAGCCAAGIALYLAGMIG